MLGDRHSGAVVPPDTADPLITAGTGEDDDIGQMVAVGTHDPIRLLYVGDAGQLSQDRQHARLSTARAPNGPQLTF
jgi:hypothetical protein